MNNKPYSTQLAGFDNSWIGENVWIDNFDNIEIGSILCILKGVMLLCGITIFIKKLSVYLPVKL